MCCLHIIRSKCIQQSSFTIKFNLPGGTERIEADIACFNDTVINVYQGYSCSTCAENNIKYFIKTYSISRILQWEKRFKKDPVVNRF